MRYFLATLTLLLVALPAFAQTGDGKKQVGITPSSPSELAELTSVRTNCVDGEAGAFPCDRINLLSRMSSSQLGGFSSLNDIWGWTDPDTGKEYALVGRTSGTNFVDVSDPENPFVVGTLPRTSGTSTNAWRDIKVFNDHAFIVADGVGNHGVQVFDLTQLRDVTSPPESFDETAIYTGIASAHNIVINEETGFAYSVGNSSGGNTCGGGLHMINIQDPANPTFAGCFSDTDTGRSGTGYTHDAQCVIYTGPDSDHTGSEICFGLNETALSIADVSDKSNPVALSTGEYPNEGYIHQGWLTEDQRFLYVNDELDESGGKVNRTRTVIWDVTDLDDPVVLDNYLHPTLSIDHNLYLRDNLMVQANYVDGVRIFDVTDRKNPRPFGYFDTTPTSSGISFNGVWSSYAFFDSGIIIASSIGEGLFVLEHAAEKISASLRISLDGAFDEDGMRSDLTSMLPTANPFEAEPFEYYGSQSVDDRFFTDNPDIVDWVLVSIRSTADGEDVDKVAGFLKEDGSVVGVDGVSDLEFTAPSGDYFFVVRHRSHLAVVSPEPVTLQ